MSQETQEQGTQGSSELKLTVIWWSAESTRAELGGLGSLSEVPGMVERMLDSGDPRLKSFDVPFPPVLSLGLSSVFVRSSLWGNGVSAADSCYVAVVAGDGRIVDLFLPNVVAEWAPKLFGQTTQAE